MAEEQPQLKRDGTMQVTAKEGIEYLKRQGKEDLVPETNANGDKTDSSNGDKPAVPREGTMEATIKDGERFLESTGGELPEEVRTRGDQEKIDSEQKEESDLPPVVREGTMVATAKAGDEFLGDDKPLGETRQQSKAIADAEEEENGDEGENDEDSNEADEGDETAALKRTHTMAETLEEGEAFLKKQKTNGDSGEEVKEDS
ncbi:uncharacterized protein LOC117100000 [Anneissia japonica]|uniref:uncharacterized protein LOC117100000 n=1 Tax=Anneissia japonica TaxID=1529436 RepID=UPI0014256C7E|nr:uncharacterized protein LOC117100000 [Anneissia japonica]